MRYFGWETATLTGQGADGGADVRADEAVAQVKAEAVKTSSERLQALFGIAAHEQRTAVFFSLGGYTRQALTWAASTGMTLFEFDHAGDIQPASRAAVDLLARRQTTMESTRAALPQVLDRTEAAVRDLGFREEARRIAAHHLAADIWFHLWGVLGPAQFSRLPDHPAAVLIFDLSLLAQAPYMAERLLGMQHMPIDPVQVAINRRDLNEQLPDEFKPLFRATLELSDALDFLWPTRDPDHLTSATE